MIKTNNKVALYARFSSDNQRSESIDAQIRAMTTYCKQHKFTIVDTYIDEAKSATTDRRPAFQQMISDSSNHNFDILLVHKLDRFARNRYGSAVYKRELKKNGVISSMKRFSGELPRTSVLGHSIQQNTITCLPARFTVRSAGVPWLGMPVIRGGINRCM